MDNKFLNLSFSFANKLDELVLVYLHSVADGDGFVDMSVYAMARDLHVHRQTLTRIIRRLEDDGHVTICLQDDATLKVNGQLTCFSVCDGNNNRQLVTLDPKPNVTLDPKPNVTPASKPNVMLSEGAAIRDLASDGECLEPSHNDDATCHYTAIISWRMPVTYCRPEPWTAEWQCGTATKMGFIAVCNPDEEVMRDMVDNIGGRGLPRTESHMDAPDETQDVTQDVTQNVTQKGKNVTNKEERKEEKEEFPPAPPIEEKKEKKEENTHPVRRAREKNPKEALEKRRKDFISSLETHVERYGREMVDQFADYWTEPNRSCTKMRFELQKTWNTAMRLATWARNDKLFNQKQTTNNNTNNNPYNHEKSRLTPIDYIRDAQQRAIDETEEFIRQAEIRRGGIPPHLPF